MRKVSLFLLLGVVLPIGAATIDFQAVGNQSAASIHVGGVVVTGGPGLVTTTDLLGLAVGGIVINQGEFLDFTFDQGVTFGISYTNNYCGGNQCGLTDVEAFDGANASLGIVAVTGFGANVSSLFGGQGISRFRLATSAAEPAAEWRFATLSYATSTLPGASGVPEPGAWVLMASGAAMIGFRVYRKGGR